VSRYEPPRYLQVALLAGHVPLRKQRLVCSDNVLAGCDETGNLVRSTVDRSSGEVSTPRKGRALARFLPPVVRNRSTTSKEIIMRKALATGLAMGIIALGSVAAPSTASALTVGQSTKNCNGWTQHSNSAVYWRTCAVITQKTRSTRYGHASLEVKNVGARSKIVTGMAFQRFEARGASTGNSVNKTLPAGQTWTMGILPWQLKGHGTLYALTGLTIRGYVAKSAVRTVGIGF